MNNLYEYVGNLHIHSLHSDGGENIATIARSTPRAGLDFICINDHSYMTDSLHLEEEGFYGDLLVLFGLEIGERYHHYLAFDLKEMIRGKITDPQRVIDEVHQQGGLGFLAHPFEKGMPFSENSVAYTWNDLSVTGYTGICIWNFTSRWKERVKSALHGIFFLLFKSQTLKEPSRKTLAFWDQMCLERKVVAIGGSDAHGSFFPWGFFRFRPLSYNYLLGTINIHILLPQKLPRDLTLAKQAIYSAMKEGRLFIAHDALRPARGFRFDFQSDEGAIFMMGEERSFKSGKFMVRLPARGEMRLLRNGKIEKKWRGHEAIYRVERNGTYRVEVYRHLPLFGWRPWIFTNPVYLR